MQNNETNENILCTKCESSKSYVQLKLLFYKTGHVKYVPQLKKMCENGHYLGFVEQTEDRIENVNTFLEAIHFEESEGR